MSVGRKHMLVLVIALAGVLQLSGQSDKCCAFSIKGQEVFLSVNREVNTSVVDSVMMSLGCVEDELDSLNTNHVPSREGWYVYELSAKSVVFKKPLNSFKGKPKSQSDLMTGLAETKMPADDSYRYGYNVFKKPSVTINEDGTTRFYLKVNGSPNAVYLSGSFNDWSTLQTPMSYCDSGYCVSVNLAPGAHYYKFIVDGYWLEDPRNQLSKEDGEGNRNSLYFKTNHTFELKGHQNAKRVYLSGSFNDWKENKIRLQRTPDGWKKDLFITEGTHAYKFIVDGNWILDPDNPVVREDGAGNQNSFLSIGDTFYFYLRGHLDAGKVIVSGGFNGWNEQELSMAKTDSGWVLPYVLAPGQYSYKFKVDGVWMLDPACDLKEGEGDYMNSVKVVEPNTTFELNGYGDANEVYVTGDFNGWNEKAYQLTYKDGTWSVCLFLPKGKHRYKFIIDGVWTLDPENPQWEPNEYGSGNSVMWVK